MSDQSTDMWEDYGQKRKKRKKRTTAGGLVGGKKDVLKPQKDKKDPTPSSPFNTSRVEAQIQIDDGRSIRSLGLGTSRPEEVEMIGARILMADLTPTGVIAFTEKKIRPGQLVQLTILDHRPFFCKARVKWVNEIMASSSVIWQNDRPFSFRIGFEFYAESAEEIERIRSYWQTTSEAA